MCVCVSGGGGSVNGGGLVTSRRCSGEMGRWGVLSCCHGDRLPIEARKRVGTGRSLNSRRWWPFAEGTWGGVGGRRGRSEGRGEML